MISTLIELAEKGRLQPVQHLINEGVDVNARHKRNTPLHQAAAGPHPLEEDHGDDYVEIVELLLNSGAKANARDSDGKTPIHAPASNKGSGYLKIVKLLIEAGADINAIDKSGNTPLHKAVSGMSLENAKLLVKAGADVNVRNEEGSTPLDITKSGSIDIFISKTEIREMEELLLAAGAKHSKKEKMRQAREKKEQQKIEKILAENPEIEQMINNPFFVPPKKK